MSDNDFSKEFVFTALPHVVLEVMRYSKEHNLSDRTKEVYRKIYDEKRSNSQYTDRAIIRDMVNVLTSIVPENFIGDYNFPEFENFDWIPGWYSRAKVIKS